MLGRIFYGFSFLLGLFSFVSLWRYAMGGDPGLAGMDNWQRGFTAAFTIMALGLMWFSLREFTKPTKRTP